MAKRTVVYVAPDKPGGWVVKKQGAKSPISTHRKKEVAIKKGKRVAKAARSGQLKILKKNGRIQTEHTYGGDPRRSRG